MSPVIIGPSLWSLLQSVWKGYVHTFVILFRGEYAAAPRALSSMGEIFIKTSIYCVALDYIVHTLNSMHYI